MNYFYITGKDGKSRVFSNESLEKLRRFRTVTAKHLGVKPSPILKDNKLAPMWLMAKIKKRGVAFE